MRAVSVRGITTRARLRLLPRGRTKPTREENDTAATPSVSGATGETTFRDAPFKVVITGSTKGLGLELARGFLANGDEVVVTSRDETRVREARMNLS